MDMAPLQIYSSGLVFAPENSVVKNKFKDQIPSWIQRQPETVSDWGPVLQTLQDVPIRSFHEDMLFSRDGSLLVWYKGHGAITLWNPATGEKVADFHVKATEATKSGKMYILIPDVPPQCNGILVVVTVIPAKQKEEASGGLSEY